MCKVSVIVPVYKVAKFIERCARSLFEQTLQDIEFIFVDDATPDASISIIQTVLAEYPNRMKQVKLITHECNKGLPAARNTGLKTALGEYVFHCDSDDFVEPDMLEKLYNTAKDEMVDIVWCDWFLSFEKNERYMKQPQYLSAMEALKGMLTGAMKYNVWNKLIKRELYQRYLIRFPEGYGMGEDMTIIMLFAYAGKVKYIPHAFYHYVKLNSNAFSQTYSEHHLVELKHNTQRIVEFIQNKFGHTLDKELSFFKLEVKFPFLIIGNKKKYKLWKEWYPEANHYILQNINVSFQNRLLQWVAWKGQYWIIWIYTHTVLKVVYGIIYR